MNRTIVRIGSAIAGATLLAAAAWAGEPRFEGMVLSDAKGGAAKNVFNPKTAKVYLTGKLQDMPAGAKVKAVWIAEKTNAAPPNYQIDATEHTTSRGMNNASFALSGPNAGWPVGDYRVELFINGKKAGTHRFSVKP
jgi:hypothetical protein